MAIVKRKITYRLYPTKVQTAMLWQVFILHQRLYNAALEQRIWAWKQNGVSLTFADQCKELTGVEGERMKDEGWGMKEEEEKISSASSSFLQSSYSISSFILSSGSWRGPNSLPPKSSPRPT